MGRAPCCDKENVKRGPWSPEEDAKLKIFVEKFGTDGSWIALPQKAGLKRCGKSCRLRWLNYLRPNLKHGDFSDEEDRIICSLYMAIGSRWSIMASHLPGRTDNDIKNHWNTKLKKKLIGATITSPSTAVPHGGSPALLYPSHDGFSTFSTSNFPAYQKFHQDGFTQYQSYHHGNSSSSINPCFFTGDTSCSSSEGSHHGHIMENEKMGYFEGFLPPASMNENFVSPDLRNDFDFSGFRGGYDTYGW